MLQVRDGQRNDRKHEVYEDWEEDGEMAKRAYIISL